ncbi:hypothetical protein [Pseudoalteromonas luteoviolacea]|uniref:Aminomethyltransferase folate-binding domain-containing protein n=1 Tax=Pseudoalteromonas luteoviolacea S4054 TaxID=1129367 RepID=A0A0F6ACI7_9GAMM|nr:hypothetical protein [Pseudoalteromonas luteoviolacea]AOT06824.1 hypothetical protein S4054249_02570 [Pseudoalteromonas luteoviolacea]AOT11742.1 hypothetical protein S40542_02570 [Pseudoalteromonas luteoviolacea]AOT16654.1 hypothetical protein S4054_02570 [Pseudoalteromonas luteoviolacea]KKE83853.1 hypothetical protein N479_12200 [Pseudoalteromonas luteoviolacea S4054]KZN74067.1 hypothetical protein N481_10160 [Pseudoalteromonas luteoviolacea S4047-1]
MTFSPIIFAKHRQGTVPAANAYRALAGQVVLDFSGFETTPFLNQELDINLNKLIAPGLGIQGSFANGHRYAVYYFSETAYRFILDQDAAHTLQALVDQHEQDYDIELMRRDDLAIAQLSGAAAFESLLTHFSLTPGLGISDLQACYGKQSGDVFITTLLQDGVQQHQLIAQPEPLSLWQKKLSDAGFCIN